MGGYRRSSITMQRSVKGFRFSGWKIRNYERTPANARGTENRLDTLPDTDIRSDSLGGAWRGNELLITGWRIKR